MEEDGVKAERRPQHPTCGTMVAGATVVTDTERGGRLHDKVSDRADDTG